MQTRRTTGRAGRWSGALVGVALAAACPALAGITEKHTWLITFDAGGYCQTEPDGSEPAPKTRLGTIDLFDEPYRIKVHKDRLAAAPGLGIALVIRLPSYFHGVRLTVRSHTPDPGEQPDEYDLDVGDDGMIWFGRSPTPGKVLSTGPYRLELLDDTRLLLAYRFEILPPDGHEPCRQLTS